jgi:uncharacterized LabA/DUF88 family protein
MPNSNTTKILEGINTKPIPIFAYIGGQNLFRSIDSQGWNLDYSKLYFYLQKKHKADQVFIFIKYYQFQKEFCHELRKIGFIIVFGENKQKVTENNKIFIKSNIDADLIVHCMANFAENQKFRLIILTADGDFIPLIKYFEKYSHFISFISPNTKDKTSQYLKYNSKAKVQRKAFYLDQIKESIKKSTDES